MNNGYVYIIECMGIYKIGKAKDISIRINQMKTDNPFPKNIIKVIEHFETKGLESSISNGNGYHDLERVLHEKLNKYHVCGEWFKIPVDVMNELINIKDFTHVSDIINKNFESFIKVDYFDPRKEV